MRQALGIAPTTGNSLNEQARLEVLEDIKLPRNESPTIPFSQRAVTTDLRQRTRDAGNVSGVSALSSLSLPTRPLIIL